MVKGKNQQSTFCKKRPDDCILLYYGLYFLEIENTILNSCSLTVWVAKGCQQGGFLSPLLLFLLVDNLLAWLPLLKGEGESTPRGTWMTCAYWEQNASQELSLTWSRKRSKAGGVVELSVNAGKTDRVVFARKRRMDGLYMPILLGQRLTQRRRRLSEVRFM